MSDVGSHHSILQRAEELIARAELGFLSPDMCRQIAASLEPVPLEQRQALSVADLVQRFGAQFGLTEPAAEELRRLLLQSPQTQSQAQAQSPAGKRPSVAVAALLLLGIAAGIFVLKKAIPPSTWHGQTRVTPTRQELNERLAQAIQATMSSKVVYEDVQGEGPGYWDPGLRYPQGTVNCIIWITQVLAEAYGHGRTDKTSVLDRLRYYGGHVSFGTRKHYLAQSMAIEPEPLRRVSLKECAPEQVLPVDLQYDRFLQVNAYGCPLYRKSASHFEVPYVDPKGLLKCAPKLKPGYYVMFGVATDKYNEIYGKESGPLGLVHGMFLEISQAPTENSIKVYHASTAAKRVKNERLNAYVAKMTQSLHRGYALYELDPAWDPDQTQRPDPETLKIQACERELLRSGKTRKTISF